MEDNVVNNFAPIGPWEDDQDALRKRIADLKNNGLSTEEAKEKQLRKILQERELEEVRSDKIEEELAVKKALSILSGDYDDLADSDKVKKSESKDVPLGSVKSEDVDGKKIYNFYNCTITFN